MSHMASFGSRAEMKEVIVDGVMHNLFKHFEKCVDVIDRPIIGYASEESAFVEGVDNGKCKVAG